VLSVSYTNVILFLYIVYISALVIIIVLGPGVARWLASVTNFYEVKHRLTSLIRGWVTTDYPVFGDESSAHIHIVSQPTVIPLQNAKGHLVADTHSRSIKNNKNNKK